MPLRPHPDKKGLPWGQDTRPAWPPWPSLPKNPPNTPSTLTPRPAQPAVGGERHGRTLAQMLDSCKLLARVSPTGAPDKPDRGSWNGGGKSQERVERAHLRRDSASQVHRHPAVPGPDTHTLTHPNPPPRCHLNNVPPPSPASQTAAAPPAPTLPPPSQAPFCTISGQGGVNRRREEGEGGRAGC